LIFTHLLTEAQQCEDFNKSLFHMLPDTFPNQINCVDSSGHKQGWWINYVVKYNPVDKPEELAKGDYVEDYSYGKYKDNLKVGDWISVANVHMLYIIRRDNYYYSEDTIMVTSRIAHYGGNETTILYNADSTVIQSTSLSTNDKYPVCIACNKKGKKEKECRMTYRNAMIKEFPFDQFEFEFSGTYMDCVREKKMINELLDN